MAQISADTSTKRAGTSLAFLGVDNLAHARLGGGDSARPLRVLMVEAFYGDRRYRFRGLGLPQLAATLRRGFGDENVEIAYCDEEYDKNIRVFRPDIVCVTSMTSSYELAKEACRAAKRRGCATIIGGTHVTLVPENLTEHMDVGVIGEGEQALLELVDHWLRNDGGWNKEALRPMLGLVFHDDDGKLVKTADRPKIRSLDELPFSSRDIFPKGAFEPYVMTARGCPYKCTFCSSSFYWNTLRSVSPEYAVAEMEQVVNETGCTELWIMDDLFIANRRRVQQIAGLFRERGLHRRVQVIVAGAKVNHISEELLDALQAMNVVTMAYGIESGNEKSLKYLKGDMNTMEENVQAIKMTRRRGMVCYGYMIVGQPTETWEDAMETLRFAKEHLDQHYRVSLITPLPGTPIWQEAKSKGLVHENMDWSVMNYNYNWDVDRAVLISDHISRDEFKEINRLALKHQNKNILRQTAAKVLSEPRWALSELKRLVRHQLPE